MIVQVNGDKTMEWDELLDYVVQTVTSTVDLGIPDNDAEGITVRISEDDANTFSYQPMSVTDQSVKLSLDSQHGDSSNTEGGMDEPFDDIYDCMQPFQKDEEWHMLCYR